MKSTKDLFEMMPQTMKHNYMVCSFADFFDCYLWIYENVKCPIKKKSVADIIFPLYFLNTGRNYNANMFEQYGALNPKN